MASDPLPMYLQEYLDSLVPPRPPEMQAMEAYAKQTNFPIIGPSSGYFCYQIARMCGARRVFELGSGYGYSTAWFARAVQENLALEGASANPGGEVHHVVWDEQLSKKARGHLGALGFGDLVRYHVGEAVEALRGADGPFDLIFNDIDKHGYPASLPVIAEKLRPGGALIIDNMLWHGAIFDPSDQSPDTRGVHEFTQLITSDPGWIASLVPLRDGMFLAYKK
ncbi:MAG TPA: O-methyltransferase [Roseiflexaceae bacterium]|nr:O-methyltransferase [Roseiflexaceae bacterium]